MTSWILRASALAAMSSAIVMLSACGGGGGSGNVSVMPPPPTTPADVQIRASGASPFTPGCGGSTLGGTVYTGAEVEPYVAINPRDATNVVGVWQQDRWSNGGAQGLLTGVSFDGGQTWLPRMAAFSRCAGGTPANGGDYERASDPWVTFGPDGAAYQIAIAFSGENFTAGSANSVLVSRSADGGRTWSDPVTLIRDGGDFFNDKESITADPTDARYVYAVWDRLTVSGTGPAMMGRTIDGGSTWEAPRAIYEGGDGNQTLNNQIVVLPDGTLVDFFTRFTTGAANALVVIRSQDKGLTWSAPVVVATVQAVGTRDPDTGTPIRDGANLGSIAAGRNGTLAVVWQDSRFSGGSRDDVAFSRSTDGGLTWTAPVRVNSVPTVPAFVPAVHVRGDGTFGVTYYDLRNNTSDPATLPTDYWLVRSTDGVNWTETHVTGPFDLALAPVSRGLFVGDYQALASTGNVFVPFYAQTNNGNASNRTDIFASLLNSAAAIAARTAQALQLAGPGGGETTFRASGAPPLAMTPERTRRLAESVARTIESRARGVMPRSVIRALAPDALPDTP